MQRVQARLLIVVPLTIAIIFVLFYLEFRSIAETLMVMLGVPLCLVGAIWYLVFLEYNMSIAVWVGIMALAGMAAETSAAMLVYLDSACARGKRQVSCAHSRICSRPCTPGRWSASAPW